ncbi:hypothetical protein RRG08_060023 [Elysia crispata]|uniref:Uncharacterized protein n=1 Tax=Elysia crispata TaxID=231223 RepID=A0AAE0YE39_9GAST|nr:hypothetical protein RRG08_060023 [Elysia crispata]
MCFVSPSKDKELTARECDPLPPQVERTSGSLTPSPPAGSVSSPASPSIILVYNHEIRDLTRPEWHGPHTGTCRVRQTQETKGKENKQRLAGGRVGKCANSSSRRVPRVSTSTDVTRCSCREIAVLSAGQGCRAIPGHPVLVPKRSNFCSQYCSDFSFFLVATARGQFGSLNMLVFRRSVARDTFWTVSNQY